MKLLFAGFLFNLVFAGAAEARYAQSQKVSVQINHEKQTPRGGLKVKFTELIEDSRCPVDTTCVWAGNAVIKVLVSKNGKSRVLELNSNLDDKDAAFAGYRFRLTKLTPELRSNIRVNRNGYVAAITITRDK